MHRDYRSSRSLDYSVGGSAARGSERFASRMERAQTLSFAYSESFFVSTNSKGGKVAAYLDTNSSGHGHVEYEGKRIEVNVCGKGLSKALKKAARAVSMPFNV